MIVFLTLGVVMMYIDGIEFLILVDHSMILVAVMIIVIITNLELENSHHHHPRRQTNLELENRDHHRHRRLHPRQHGDAHNREAKDTEIHFQVHDLLLTLHCSLKSDRSIFILFIA